MYVCVYTFVSMYSCMHTSINACYDDFLRHPNLKL
jgi:hypothetical protein